MIPKIIHFTRDDGSEFDLNSTNWEIMNWNTKEIKKEMKKYPKIWRIYNAVSSNDTKNVLSKYVIMREHGGICFDCKDCKDCKKDDRNDCNAYKKLLDDIFKKENTKDVIYIGACNSFYFFTDYSLDFLAMERNHPIWKDVWTRVEHYTDDNAINNALFHCINHSDKYEIMEVFKQSDNTFRTLQKNKTALRMKQLLMFIAAICIIIFVEQLYHYNVSLYGAINFIPGIGVVSSSSKQDKDKKKKK
jgi:hypothetical protein